MNFTSEEVQAIVSGKKTVHSVLVKDGEFAASSFFYTQMRSDDSLKAIFREDETYKWKVGRDYEVCVKNKAVWVCPECNYFEEATKRGHYCFCPKCKHKPLMMGPLRVVITGIEKKENKWKLSFKLKELKQ